MFKRVMWWATGAVMGAAGSTLAQRKVKRQLKATAERYTPPALADRARQRVSNAATGLVGDVRDAFDEGRAAASDRHVELRERLGIGAKPSTTVTSLDGTAHDRSAHDHSTSDSASQRVASVTELHPGHPSGGGRPGQPVGPTSKPNRLGRLRRRS
jgi:hypothetical protein